MVSPVGIGLLSFSSPLFSSPSDSAVTFPLHSLFGNNSTTTVSPCTALLRFLLPHTNTPQLRSETGQKRRSEDTSRTELSVHAALSLQFCTVVLIRQTLRHDGGLIVVLVDIQSSLIKKGDYLF